MSYLIVVAKVFWVVFGPQKVKNAMKNDFLMFGCLMKIFKENHI